MFQENPKYFLSYRASKIDDLLKKIDELGLATQETDGLMSSADKAKLDTVGVFCDTTANWNAAIGYIPAEGNIIVYTDHRTVNNVLVPGIKIGTGNAYVQDLAFIDDAVAADLAAHIGNANIHVSAQERTAWNNKLNMSDEVVNETLVFTRN